MLLRLFREEYRFMWMRTADMRDTKFEGSFINMYVTVS